jgi:hypothetical protein
MKRQQILTSVLVLGLLLALAVGLSLAQEPEPPEEEINALSVIEADSVSGRIPIQGRLTDNNDDPVADAWYKFTFRLYEQSTEGTPICTFTRYPSLIAVVDGLFSTYMDCGDVLHGQEVWLSIEVEDDGEMTPRQSIYPVPYALTLRPGALISSSISGAIVHIENSHTSGRGLRSYATAESGVSPACIQVTTWVTSAPMDILPASSAVGLGSSA